MGKKGKEMLRAAAERLVRASTATEAKLGGAKQFDDVAVAVSDKSKHVAKFKDMMAKMCASSCFSECCRSSGFCVHVYPVDDGYRHLSAANLFYALYDLDYAAITVTPLPATYVVDVTQFAFLAADGTVTVTTYTGTAPVVPANSTMIVLTPGSGLTNVVKLRDLIVISGVTTAVGVPGTGTTIPNANLFNSKYYVSSNFPAGTFTLTPLSVADYAVNDSRQITNYVNLSLAAPLVLGLNLLVTLTAVNTYLETLDWVATGLASSVPARLVHASYVEACHHACGTRCGCCASGVNCGGVRCAKTRMSFGYDSPARIVVHHDTRLDENTRNRYASHLPSDAAYDDVAALLKQGEEGGADAAGAAGFVYDDAANQLRRGSAHDALKMNKRQVKRYLDGPVAEHHRRVVAAFASAPETVNMLMAHLADATSQ